MRHYLAVVSTVQLGLDLAGLQKALREGAAYDLPFTRGNPDHVGRDAWLMGTASSGPVVMMALQAVCTARLLRRPDTRAARTLGVLGVLMSIGSLLERSVWQAWLDRDSKMAAKTAGGVALTVAMAWLGLRTTGAR